MVGAGLVGLIAGILFLALGWHVYAVRKLDERLRAETVATNAKIADLQDQRADLERFFLQPANAKLHDRAAFLNSLIDERSFDWTQMFMDLERILPGGVRVVSIEPRQVKGRVEVKLTVGTATEEAKDKFLRALEESRQFSSIQLDSEKPAVKSAGSANDLEIMELSVVYSRI
jgi:type IV pilus assembly protein PilN